MEQISISFGKNSEDVRYSESSSECTAGQYMMNHNSFPHYHQSVGVDLTSDIFDTLSSLNLTTVLGYSPQDYFATRVPFGHPDSLLTKLMNDILPTVVKDKARDRSDRAKLYMANSGCQRFQVVCGFDPYTLLRGQQTDGSQSILSCELIGNSELSSRALSPQMINMLFRHSLLVSYTTPSKRPQPSKSPNG